ncbi:MAG: hypothetical protein AUK49_11025 [Betaproteobacteria bacterium CG2_30_68_42]|nr:MAG: hypothetical protein AUK49_11025 [Betaproteobacteria bacterium CG2_30_68_42]
MLFTMLPRDAAGSLRRLAGWYPVVAPTGPRQAGRTTLARMVFHKHPCPEQLYSWRDGTGREIDLLVERCDRLLAIECKAGQTVAQDWFAPVEGFLSLAGNAAGMILYGGDRGQPRSRTPVVGWRRIATALARGFGTAAK